MDFTREPIIETIITPKEGYKLVIRSSKSTGQEEYFVDAVEIVSFGQTLFFRSLERPKAFIVPVSDYEVLEVREARMVLKNAGLDRSIKIGGGREGTFKAVREIEKGEAISEEGIEEKAEQEEAKTGLEVLAAEVRPEIRVDKKRDRRRHYRKRRGREEREEGVREETVVEPTAVPPLEDEKIDIPPPKENVEKEEGVSVTSNLLSSLLQPPPTLISETMSRYRQNELFKGAFYLTEEEQYKPHDKVQELLNEEDEEGFPSLQEPSFIPEEEKPSEEVSKSFLAKEEKEECEKKEECEEKEEIKEELPFYVEEETTMFPGEEVSPSPASSIIPEEEKPLHHNHFPQNEEN